MKQEKLQLWQQRFDKSKRAYESELAKMDTRDSYYKGTRKLRENPNTNQKVTKESTNVRNIVYELIECQVDSTQPMPRVTAIHEEDKPLAKAIEAMLRSEIVTQRFSDMNDLQERTVPVQGGSIWQVDWDNTRGTHCTLGDLKITDRHPKQVIPQDGVTEIEDMDYIFLLVARTKKSIERQYHVTLNVVSEEEPGARGNDGEIAPADDIVTQVLVYFRNDSGGIGLYSWVGDQTLDDYEDYQTRRLERCTECGAPKSGKVCPVCGGTKFKEGPEEYEELTQDIVLFDGTVVPQFESEESVEVLDEKGNTVFDEDGQPMQQFRAVPTRVPYYNPKEYPLILRRNIRQFGIFLGTSDVDIIMDQQDTIKKLGTKIDEKCLKGGSFVTLPAGVNMETSDREFKIARVKDLNEKGLIGVINVQPDCSRDLNVLEQNYSWAKSTLGITDAFQGKYDSSATSGAAKQFSANQSAGRLESKRKQKNSSYAKLFELMFQYLLAYADQPIPYKTKNDSGDEVFEHFDRWKFLRRDAAGELYWDDEFLFEIDPSATLSSNRESLWNTIDVKYQAGGFGPLNDLNTQVTLWKLLYDTDFPFAGDVLKDVQARNQKQMEMEAQANAMPQMPDAAGNLQQQAEGDGGQIPG